MSPAELAVVFGVCVGTVYRWASSGRIYASGRPMSFTALDVIEFARERYLSYSPRTYTPWGTEVTDHDREVWSWNPWNEVLLDRWLDPSHRSPWSYMSPMGFVMYWDLVVRPRWEREYPGRRDRRPQTSWLDRSGFRGLGRAIRSGYLWEFGVRTLSGFFARFTDFPTRGRARHWSRPTLWLAA